MENADIYRNDAATAAGSNADAVWATVEKAVAQVGPGLVLERLRAQLRRSPDDGLRHVYNRLMTNIFADSRRLFAEERWLEAAYLFSVLGDFGEPAQALRADARSMLAHLSNAALKRFENNDIAAACQGCRQVLALDPGFDDGLNVMAYIERRHGDAAAGLIWTLRTLRAKPSTQYGDTHMDVGVRRAGEALVQALADQDTAAAAKLTLALQRGDAAFEQLTAQAIAAKAGPRDFQRLTLLWLTEREYAQRQFETALAYAEQAAAIQVGPMVQRWEGLIHQQLMLNHLRVALRSHCSAYVNDIVGQRQSRDVFRALDTLMVQGLEVENVDAWTRTQYWGSLIGWRAMVDYAETLNRNPYVPSMNVPYVPPASPRNGERRVFDCCTFFNEAEVLEIRLRELYDVVDGFVIAEATHTHAGQPKPLVFDQHRDRFAPWLDKIVYVVDDKPVQGFAWKREAQQRDTLLNGLTACRDDDIIIVSDVDEIVRRDVAASLRRADPDCEAVFTLEMDLFFYRLNFRFGRDWRSAGAAPYRIVKKTGTNAVRYLALQGIGPLIPAAGWHFSWMGDVDRFIAKMTAYAHQEHAAGYAAESQRHAEDLRRFLTEGGRPPACGPGNGLSEYTLVPVDDDFPLLVREAYQRYADMGWLGREKEAGTDE